MATKVESAVDSLELSLIAARFVLTESAEPLQRRLTWLASELERLAGEAYRLADEAGDDPGSSPAYTGWEPPVPGFDPVPTCCYGKGCNACEPRGG